MIDIYNLKARIYPVIILFFPIIIIGVIFSIEFESYLSLLSSFGIMGTLIYLFSQLGRDQGKLKEPLLWESWGGCPSIQILRITNPNIDSLTKNRYHSKLLLLCPVGHIPDEQLELTQPKLTDNIYQSWTKFLISQTRDIKTYPLLFKENVSYGFRRNLWGLKPFALGLIIFFLVSGYLYFTFKYHNFNPIYLPERFILLALSLILILVFWVVVVKKNWIKIPSFAYAERLVEATETLN